MVIFWFFGGSEVCFEGIKELSVKIYFCLFNSGSYKSVLIFIRKVKVSLKIYCELKKNFNNI